MHDWCTITITRYTNYIHCFVHIAIAMPMYIYIYTPPPHMLCPGRRSPGEKNNQPPPTYTASTTGRSGGRRCGRGDQPSGRRTGWRRDRNGCCTERDIRGAAKHTGRRCGGINSGPPVLCQLTCMPSMVVLSHVPSLYMNHCSVSCIPSTHHAHYD